jgi:hypothetical protein
VSEDLTARVAELAAQIGERLDEDEAAAQRAESRDAQHEQHMPEAEMRKCVELASRRERNYDQPWWAANMRYQLDRSRLPSDPARERRRVKAARDLAAAILAEGHQYVDGDPWFSCSQATEPGEDDSEPGSACADDERRGQPCDCGRDSRVARLLGIIAGEWEG